MPGHRTGFGLLLAVAASVLIIGSADAYSIVNMPTANQAALHELNLAYYGMSVQDLPVSHKDIIIVYSTVAEGLELEYERIEINNGAPAQDIFNASYKLLPENQKFPDVVVGAKNIFKDENSPSPDEREVSFYVATAKTLNPPKPGAKWSPVVRLHVNYGTKEHRGLFGGVQIAITPQLGFAALRFTSSPYADTFFGNPYEFALVYSMGKNKPTLKAGLLGEHQWLGLDYSIFY